VRTLIVSDLHLGSGSGVDVLRRPGPRDALLDALDGCDRLVLLGDVFELRHGPAREALAAGQQAIAALGAAMAGRQIVISAGNHDYGLIAPWLRRRGADGPPHPLGTETLAEPAEVSSALERIAAWAAPANVVVAYPGIWVREDVWAHHGHYLDVHLAVPSMERVAAGVMGRVAGEAGRREGAEAYEARLGPLYAWIEAVADQAPTSALLNGEGTVIAWRVLRGRGAGPGRRLLSLAAAAGFPLAVAGMNRAGLGPLSADISPRALQRAGLQAMGEVLARLHVSARHVIFGHTHRAGPLAGDEEGPWRTPSGASLHNCGSWVYETHFMSAGDRASPYWPGVAVEVGDTGPPRLLHLLAQAPVGELRPAPA
jgi:Calcineurin-like phosphoesterase